MQHGRSLGFMSVIGMTLLSFQAPGDESPRGGALAELRFPDAPVRSVEGESRPLAALRGRSATVVVFLSTECPIARGYTATLNALQAKTAPQGVGWIGLNPNADQSLEEMRNHQSEMPLAFPVCRDEGGRIARGLGVSVCPTVVVFDASGTARYRGRIDDRYRRRAASPVAVQTHDLATVLADLLAGRPIQPAETEPIGCPIRFPEPERARHAAAVEYHRDVVPLLQRHCIDCHRPGGIGPFALTTYDQVSAWRDDIVLFTQQRKMPPWKPVPGYGSFHNERSLSDAERTTLARWVELGCPEGDPAAAPPPREFPDGWTLGQPDAVIMPDKDYHLDAEGPDVYRCFVLPTDFDGDRYVAAIEVLPGNRKVVHHVIAFLDTSDRSLELDRRDPEPGYSTAAGFPGFMPAGGLGGWAPGMTSPRLPDGMAKVLPKGAKIVLQVHYHKTGKPETDRTRLGLYWAKPPVTRAVHTLPVGSARGPFRPPIPAGNPHYEVRAQVTVPRDLLAVSITPHMHLIGKEMKVTATLPDGTVTPLVFIADWDFNWQGRYQYREPVRLPKGTRIELVARYDNSEANPNNPHRPPRPIRWGEQTTDEMCLAFLDVASVDEARTAADLRPPRPGELLREILADRLRQRWGGRSRE